MQLGFSGGSVVKNLDANVGDSDSLEKEMATDSSILAWKIPWAEGYSPWGQEESNIN